MHTNEHRHRSEAQTPSLRSDPDQLYDTSQVARFTSLSETYLRQMRVSGGGPRYLKLTAKAVRYRASDVLAWIDARPAVGSTSELEAA